MFESKKSPGALRLGLIVAGIAILVGCSTRMVDYTILSTKNVDLSRVGSFRRSAERVTGKDTQFWLIIIPVSGSPNLKEAIDRAVERVPGAVALVDGVVYYRAWWFIFGSRAIIVEGTPLIDPEVSRLPALRGGYMVSFFNPRTGTQEARATDPETFQKLRELARRDDPAGIQRILAGWN
jgi:hypothetical protein